MEQGDGPSVLKWNGRTVPLFRLCPGLGMKLLLLVLLLSMLITTAMSILFYGRVRNSVEMSYRNTVEENLRTRAELFDSMMKNAYLTCTYASENENLTSLLEQELTDESYEELVNILRRYCEEDASIQSIYCFIRSTDELVKVSIDDSQVLMGAFANHAWINRAAAGADSDPFSPVYNLDSTFAVRRNFFTYGKKLYNSEGQQTGHLFVNVDERQVYFTCLQTDGDSLGTLSVVQNGRIVASDRASRLRQNIAEDGKSILVQVSTDASGYSLCSVSSAEVLSANLRSTRNWILLVALLLNLILAVPVYLLLRGMLKPMKQLEDNMNRVKEGDLTVRAGIIKNDEIGSLSSNFNDMLDQIEMLIDELASQKMQKKEAELAALSYQITPHFMYNTLSSIRYAAILDGYEEIGDLLQAFIELLRLSASDRGAFITVQQECRMVSSYIMLQQFRYKDSFEAEVIMDAGTEEFYVPRLLVQPLVENAILHGLNHAEQGNRILVTVSRNEQQLVIRVSDNGSGMSREEIDTLLSGGFHSKFSGIGINNIIERLRLYYGERGRLEYQSPIEGGTAAIITLPLSDDPEEYSI